MPNIFLSGEIEFKASGNAEGLKEVAKAIKANEAGIDFLYEEKDIPCSFELWPWHVQNGKIEMVVAKNKTISCKFSGVAKIPVGSSTLEWLLKNKAPLHVAGIKGNGWVLEPIGYKDAPMKCPLSLSSKVPK